VVETKGREDLDSPPKMIRPRQCCEDINSAQSEIAYDFVFVDDAGFEKYKPKNFAELIEGFKDYKQEK
jgi:type III restriction enzyme